MNRKLKGRDQPWRPVQKQAQDLCLVPKRKLRSRESVTVILVFIIRHKQSCSLMMPEGTGWHRTKNQAGSWAPGWRNKHGASMCLQQVRMPAQLKGHATVSQLLSPETSKMLRKGRKEGWTGCGSCKIMSGTGSSYLEKSKLLEPFTTTWTASENFRKVFSKRTLLTVLPFTTDFADTQERY